MKKRKGKLIWLPEPEEHDYPAAQDYLDLHFKEATTNSIVSRLRAQPTITKKAKDILRASGLPLLNKDNIHVNSNLKKVKRGEHLSPVLLVRNENRLIIADGYHRVCAIYYLSEDLDIPCRITSHN
jgi:hypothetical protein